MVYRDLYCQGKELLRSAGIEEADLEARLLLEHACGTARNDLLAHGDRVVVEEREAAYRQLLGRRMERIPLQHLTGVQEFMGLEFSVDGHVLIPRQDTEILVEEVLRNLHDGMRILDLCTGSGCILISLLHYSNHCKGVGADISREALALAEENAQRLLGRPGSCADAVNTRKLPAAGKCPEGSVFPADTGNVSEEAGKDGAGGNGVGGASFICSDLFEKISGKFDVIVSNPPYIRSEVIGTLMPEVREHEPRLALDGGEDGLFFYRRIVEESRAYLFGGGMLFFEIGYDQGEDVRALMEQAGFLEVNVVKDYAGLDRVVYGTRSFGGRQEDLC